MWIGKNDENRDLKKNGLYKTVILFERKDKQFFDLDLD